MSDDKGESLEELIQGVQLKVTKELGISLDIS